MVLAFDNSSPLQALTYVHTFTHTHTHTHTHTVFLSYLDLQKGQREKRGKTKKKTSSKFDLNKMVIQMGPLLISQRCVIIYNIWL